MPEKAVRKTRAKNLVVVESPTKAGTIHKLLGRDFQVEASYGHVRDLPKSTMGVDVQAGFVPQYIIPAKSKKMVNKLIKQADGKETIFLAADPDREGEAICWHLAEIFKNSGAKLKRVEYHELTKEAVAKAFEHPREINRHLVDAQQARRILDRIVGYELSPLLWKKVQRGLSAGRVQSVALRLIVEREREIRNFKAVEYWTLWASLSSLRPEQKEKVFLARLDRIGKKKAEIHNETEMLNLKALLEKSEFKVCSIQKKERRRKPQAPYTTSKLQQEAYTRLGFSASKTMKIAQQLYEGIELGAEGSTGLITYMRTDSVNLAESARKECVRFIQERFGGDYLPKTPNFYRSKKGAQEAHEAIRATSAYRVPEDIKGYLTDDQFKLYELIWRKFVSSQMTPAVDLVTTIEIEAAQEHFFKTTGTRNLFPGFLAVFSDIPKQDQKKETAEEEPENQDFPELEEGEPLRFHELSGKQHFTKPPPRYNDASLVKVLEEEGIGRPSTYAPTIGTLVARYYVERNGGALKPTEIAETVIDLLVQHFPYILDIQFTARMEEDLDRIEEGQADWVKILQEFYGSFESHLNEAKEKMQSVKREAVATNEVCEKCGKPMVIKWGRFGKFMACSGFPECRNTKAISTGIKCPKENCEGQLVARRGKGGRRFYGCSKYPACDFIANKLPEDPAASSPSPQNPSQPETTGNEPAQSA